MRPRWPPAPAWRAFLKHHLTELVALDFFTVPRVGFKVLFVLIVSAHDRRKVLHFNVTEHPTARWTAQQLVETFPRDTAPKYLLRDRDAVYGERFQRRVTSLGVEQVLTSYFHYYRRWRTHLSLDMDCLDPRPVQPPEQGAVVAFPKVGGLHHHYERMAA